MTRQMLLIFALLAAIAPSVPAQSTDTAGVEKELRRMTGELMDAVAPGNWEVWDRYLDDAVLITDENGLTMTKSELHDSFKPLPPGYSGSIEITRFRLQLHGETAIALHEDFEHEDILGHKIEARYRITDTYMRKKGRWQMIASQVFVVPTDPAMASVDPKIYDAYAGIYQLTPAVTYTVAREGNKLFGQRSGHDKQELLPEGDTIFFVAGAPRSRKVFVKDESGKASELRDRRDGRDLVWTRAQ